MKNKSKTDLFKLWERLPKIAIGNDFIMTDDISMIPLFDYPVKIDYFVGCIGLKGCIDGTINLKPASFSENDVAVIFPGQIVQYTNVSTDFSGLLFVMSERFINNLELSIKDTVPVMLHLKDNPVLRLAADEIEHLLKYYDIMQHTIRTQNGDNVAEIVRLLVQAFFYSINNFGQLREKSDFEKTKHQRLFDTFYKLVLEHYKTSRKTEFYALKLCLTPKYLSSVIKKTTGKSVSEWIENYVVLEAKSLLKSSNMTIQQISDELNFANQSFFGKFFKRTTGRSPKEYRSNV